MTSQPAPDEKQASNGQGMPSMPRWGYGIPALLLGLMAWVVWQTPQEQVLGTGLKIVVVHVSSIWTGLTCFVAMFLVGLVLLVRAPERGILWSRVVAWMAVCWYGLGFSTSLLAAYINWGGVLWTEPRMAMSLRVMIVSLPVATLLLWLKQVRLLGALMLIPPAYVVWSLSTTRLLLHPRNPIQSATSLSIQGSFLMAFGLLVALSLWFAWWVSRRFAHGRAS